MSFYDMIIGRNPWGLSILKTLDLDMDELGRYRDCFVTQGEIAVYTRCGGGNRAEYSEMFERMRQHPLYLRDKDDSFDSTYATIWFKLPPQWAHLLDQHDIGEPFDPSKRWKEALERIGINENGKT